MKSGGGGAAADGGDGRSLAPQALEAELLPLAQQGRPVCSSPWPASAHGMRRRGSLSGEESVFSKQALISEKSLISKY